MVVLFCNLVASRVPGTGARVELGLGLELGACVHGLPGRVVQLLPCVAVEDQVVEGPGEPQHRLREQPLAHLGGDVCPGLVEGVELDVQAVGGAPAVLELGEPALHKLHHVRPSLVVDAHGLEGGGGRGGEGQRT